MSQSADVLCAGILVADHVCTPIDHLPVAGELVLADRLMLTLGGCAANVAVGLAKMGVSAAVAGRVGNDVFGRVVTDLLRETGVDVSAVTVTPGVDTSQTLIVNVKGQDRRFIHTFGANAAFRAFDVPTSARCKVFYLGGYFILDGVTQDELGAVFFAARKSGVQTVLDVATPGPGDYLPRLEKLLPLVDVFLPNDHEAALITGVADPVRQAECFRALGAKTAVITQGDRGAVLVSERARLRSGTFPIEFVDGSGGGDAFAAGYIAGLLRGLDEAGCLRLASAMGASCVRAIGTTTGVFTRAECDAFLAKNELKIERL